MQTPHTLCLPAPAAAGPFARFVADLIEGLDRVGQSLTVAAGGRTV